MTTSLGQVISNTRAHDAAADDYDVCGFHAGKSMKEEGKSKDGEFESTPWRTASTTYRINFATLMKGLPLKAILS
jgi:hypothetical protein